MLTPDLPRSAVYEARVCIAGEIQIPIDRLWSPHACMHTHVMGVAVVVICTVGCGCLRRTSSVGCLPDSARKTLPYIKHQR